jgi:(p)ppGpp synthase/HD superfamily hydrolase
LSDTRLSPRFVDAVEFARAHHEHDVRKGTSIPYLSHLLAVASITLDHGGSEDQAIAALLHDVAEDRGGQSALDAIAQRFGPEVARIVAACSDTVVEPKPPWRERKTAYIAAIATKRPDELLVSAADKVHNARAILADYREVGDELWSRFTTASSADQLWYYRALADAFLSRRANVGRVADELDAVVGELETEVGS